MDLSEHINILKQLNIQFKEGGHYVRTDRGQEEYVPHIFPAKAQLVRMVYIIVDEHKEEIEKLGGIQEFINTIMPPRRRYNHEPTTAPIAQPSKVKRPRRRTKR